MKKFLMLSFTVLCVVGSLWAQRSITGTVVDETGEPLIGANVVVKGTTVGTVTDFDGNFSLTVPEGSNTLLVSYTGYTALEVEIGNQTTFNLQMQVDRLLLDEVVVTAYGTQRKREITGSVTSVKADEIEKIQTSNVVQGLTGKVPGVRIIAQSGQPGDAPTILFRGIGSYAASNDPLYVVDGVPFQGNISAIAPQDIESISFLKDASANALYGSRGANGVVIITTKKGGTRGLEVTVDARVGVNSRGAPEYDIITEPGEFYEVFWNRHRIGLMQMGVSAEEAAQTASQNLITGGSFPLGYNNYDVPDDQVIDPATGRLNPNANLLYHDDWADELFDNSLRKELYVGLRSNTDQLGTYLSFGYLDDEGYALNSGFERASAHASFDYKVTEAIDVGASVNYANTIQDAPVQNVGSSTYSNLFSWARNVAPIYPVFAYDEMGNRINNNRGVPYDFGTNDDGVPGVRPYGAFNNPVATSIYDIDQNVLDNLSGRAQVSIDILKDFTFTYAFSADFVNGNITEFATPIGGDASNVGGRLTTTSNRALNLAHQQFLSWSKEFGQHNLSLMVGHESSDYNFRLLRGQKTQNLIGDIAILNNATSIQYLQGYEKDYRVEGYLFRANYDFNERFFVNASFRRDGSSVFSPDNRWGSFFGFGVAYDLGKDIVTDGAVLSSLRVKASYGQQGNDAIQYQQNRTIIGDADNRNYYVYTDQYDVINAGGGVPGVLFASLGNPDLVWETSSNINAGVEFGLFRDRLLFNVEYFQRSVEDLIFYKPLPLSEGVSFQPENVGDMKNTGVEGVLIADVVRTSDFNWSLNVNATHVKNKMTSLPQEFIDDGLFRLEEGRNRYEYYTFQFAGVDPENGDALWYMDELDSEGNPTGNRVTTNDYTQADEYFIGKTAIPDLYGGFGTSLSYKGLALDIGFSYQLGGYGFDGLYQALLPAAGDVGHNYHKDIYDTWTPENPNASLPRIDVFDDDQNNTSDLFLIDMSYLSLNDITLSYDMKFNFLERAKINSAQVYVTANNVKLWSKRDGFDPRLSIVGNALNEYSIMRSVSFGIKASF